MDSNPYLPPSSRIPDAPAPARSGAPPRVVVRAVWLLRFFILGSLPISTLLFVSSPDPGDMVVLGGGAMALPTLFLVLSWPLSAGRRWARIVTTSGAALFLAYAGTTVFSITAVIGTGDPGAVAVAALWALAVLTLLQAVGICAATGWLWGKSARRWFRERRSG